MGMRKTRRPSRYHGTVARKERKKKVREGMELDRDAVEKEARRAQLSPQTAVAVLTGLQLALEEQREAAELWRNK